MKIAFLHALPFDERMWEPQLPALAEHEIRAPKLYDLGSSMDEWALGVLQQVPGRLVAVGEAAAKTFFAPETPAEVVEWAHAIVRGQDPEGLVRAIEAIRDRPDSTEAVTSGIPLLVAAGELDPLIGTEVAHELATSSPTGRAEVLEGCGHLPSMERPDEFNRILATFLATL